MPDNHDGSRAAVLAELSLETRTPLNGILGTVNLLLDQPLAPRQKEYAQTIRTLVERILTTLKEHMEAARVEPVRAERHAPPLLDSQEFLGRLGHDALLGTEVIDSFSVRGPQLAAVIAAAARGSDGTLLGAAAQHLRTMALTICSPALNDAARDVEHCTRFGDWARAQLLAARLPSLVDAVVAALDPLRPRRVDPPVCAFPAAVAGEAAAASEGAQVLAVDDDGLSLILIRRSLEHCGYGVLFAANVDEARRILAGNRVECVITDYQMPGENGLDLVRWLRREDPALAVVMVTAEADQRLAEASLRDRVFDFLSKPVWPEVLQDSVARAVAATREQRALGASRKAVRSVVEAHNALLATRAAGSRLQIETCCVPKHEAGGDAIAHYDLDSDRSLVILTDVSGHDLGAAFCSAYFHGMVRGMLEHDASLETVFRNFNRRLLEWKNNPMSIAAAGILFNAARGEVEVMTAGAPSPLYVDSEGRALPLAPSGSNPLGWFEQTESSVHKTHYGEGAHFLLWSDGLEQVAARLDVSPACLPCLLFDAERRGRRPGWLAGAADDVIAACVRRRDDCDCGACHRLLVSGICTSEDVAEIDAMQRTWENSIRLAAPWASDETIYDILLCSREAVLNALRHGLAGGGQAVYQLTCVPERRLFRVRVDDPGPGHSFDLESHRRAAESTLIDRQRGLLLIHQLADTVVSGRQGASLTMDFERK